MRVSEVVKNVVEESSDEKRPLDGESGKQKVESNRAPSVPFEECHQEAKPDDNHDMRILKP